MIDFHSHILHGIDDGAGAIDDSIALVNILQSQNVSDIVLTPHFYPDQQSMERFLKNRNQAFDQLSEAFNMQKEIRFYLGAEVFCSEYLLISKNLEPLCISGTRLLLLEMPFSRKWPSEIWRVIDKLTSADSIIPVIAHAERYPAVQKHPHKILNKLIDAGCVIQINCDSIIDSSMQEKVLTWIYNGKVHLLGTDCHNLDFRTPHMKEACDIIDRELGGEVIAKFEKNASRLLSGKFLRGQNIVF